MAEGDLVGPGTAEQILLYLDEHPRALDTLEGIEWWLLEQGVQSVAPQLEQALGELVREGSVLTRDGPDGRCYYALNHDRRGAIRARLAHSCRARDAAARAPRAAPGGPDLEEIRRRVKRVVSAVANVPVDQVSDAASCRGELALDSLSALEVMIGVEFEFGLKPREDDTADVKSVESMVRWVERRLAQGG